MDHGFYRSLISLQNSLGSIRHITSLYPRDCADQTIGEMRDKAYVQGNGKVSMKEKIPFVETDQGFVEVKDSCIINPHIHRRVLFISF